MHAGPSSVDEWATLLRKPSRKRLEKDMTPVQHLLVTLLAQTDALHEPYRDCHSPVWSATWQVRWAYPTQGIPYRGSGSKDAERDLTEAVVQGLILRRRGR